MKILVIGSGGFIGRAAYSYFENIHEVQGCDVIPTAQDKFTLLNDEVNFNDLFENYFFDVCINCSGNGSVPISIANPALDYELNTHNVFLLLEAIRKHSPLTKFVNLSSAAVYGNPQHLPISESDSISPLSPYGWHKHQSEVLIKEYCQLYEIKGVSLRVFSAYGEGLRKQLFWDTYQKYLQNNKEITLFGEGTESRDFIYIQDLCIAIEKTVEGADFKGESINVASGEELTIREAVHYFMAAIDKDCKLIFNNITKQGDPKNWRADISKLKQLGFKSSCTFKENIQRVAAWVVKEKK